MVAVFHRHGQVEKIPAQGVLPGQPQKREAPGAYFGQPPIGGQDDADVSGRVPQGGKQGPGVRGGTGKRIGRIGHGRVNIRGSGTVVSLSYGPFRCLRQGEDGLTVARGRGWHYGERRGVTPPKE